MAGFQVANFDFGKNIVDANIKRQQIAANAATAARAQDVQMRGQDMAAQQNEARMAEQAAAREENARQFDENMADRQAARDENARQFDERTAREDRKYEDDRRDKAHAQSWDDAIKQQELDAKHAAYLEHSARLNSLLDIKAKEDEQAAHRQQAIRSDYGDAAIVAHLQGGFLTPSQRDEFNRVQIESGNMEKGEEFDAISDSDPFTGEKFKDNSLHFIRYGKDKSGNIVYVNPQNPQQLLPREQGGQPVKVFDSPLNADFRNSVLSEYFGNVKQFGIDGKGSRNGLTFDQRKELSQMVSDRQAQSLEAKKQMAAETSKNQKARLASSIAKNMSDIKRGLKLNDEQAAAFQTSLTQILSDAFMPQVSGNGGQDEVKSGDNGGAGTDEDELAALEEEAARRGLK